MKDITPVSDLFDGFRIVEDVEGRLNAVVHINRHAYIDFSAKANEANMKDIMGGYSFPGPAMCILVNKIQEFVGYCKTNQWCIKKLKCREFDISMGT